MTFEEAHRCIKRGDLLALNSALEAGLNANLINQFGWTLMMLVALEGNSSVGKSLFNAGAEVNAANNFGETPFSLAAHAGHLKFARWLLSVGAARECRPHGHDLASWIAISSGLPENTLAQALLLAGDRRHVR